MRPVTLIVALDVPDAASARSLVETLGDSCDFYKVGLELFTAEGPPIVGWLRDQGKRVFVDLKLHDIPNTVRSAARSVARHGASLLTVHASGGSAMIRAAVEGASEGGAAGRPPCGILGVTVLTSLDAASLGQTWGREVADVEAEVLRLAGLARDGGAVGIVCSGHEAAAARAAYGEQLGLLVPGIRLPGGESHDQRRVMTPVAAAEAGARWLILGRAVTSAADPAATMADVRAALPR
ncbi:MAG: orotidine-5'-phosphate decarboxylase [Gemmatimonadaceae bacterium]|nr:orotidine-5'-phosphate decarboxylase [Gemmatimonadaceae bacterium]